MAASLLVLQYFFIALARGIVPRLAGDVDVAPVAEAAFKDAKVTLTTLSNYDAVLEEAVRTHYIDESEIAVLQEWRKDPANWDPK